MSRASSLGYLKDGGSVKLTVSSRDSGWSADAKDDLAESMDGGVSGKSVTIYLSYAGAAEPDTVIAAGTGGSKTYTYAQWQALQAQKAAAGRAERKQCRAADGPPPSPPLPRLRSSGASSRATAGRPGAKARATAGRAGASSTARSGKDFGKSVDGLFSGGKSSIGNIIGRLG
jgi:hypothetical protein